MKVCRSCHVPLLHWERRVCDQCAFEMEGRPPGPYRKLDDERKARFTLYKNQGLTLVSSAPAQLSPARGRKDTQEVSFNDAA